MEKFILYWMTGESEVVEGSDITDAMNKAGYGRGSLPALDFFDYGSVVSYSFDWKKHEWKKEI